jgi:hypothetical protein
MTLADTILVCLNRVKPYLHRESALLIDVRAENRALNPSRTELRLALDSLEAKFQVVAVREDDGPTAQHKYKITQNGEARVVEIS